jgi:hypothetical protein
MAIGFWSKLKAFGKKLVKGAKTVYTKVIKPAFNILKPALKTGAAALGGAYGGPGGAALASGAFEVLDEGINGHWGAAVQKGKAAIADGSVPIPDWLRKQMAAGGGGGGG